MATLGELIVEHRVLADDTVAPYLTDDPTLARWATEAEREACIRARLLREDGVLADVTTITVTAGAADYPIDPLVHFIDSARFTREGATRSCQLDLTGMDWIQEQPCWTIDTCSTPQKLADNGRNAMRLWPIPSVAGTLQLSVYRYPLFAMEDPADEPEIREEHHMGLVQWMLFRYYSQKDSEQYDPQRAAQAEGQFEAQFGKRDTADVMRRHRERRRVTTRYGGL